MRFIPNENTWIGFAATQAGSMAAPKLADVTGAVDLTKLVMGVTASTSGNSVPTPSFDTKFETSIAGTVTAQFSIDFYRDNVVAADVAYSTFPRGTAGNVYIARTKGGVPVADDAIENWSIQVLSRSHPNMTNNTPVSITVAASCPEEAEEDAVISAT